MKKISVPTPRQLPSGSWRVQLLIDGKRISVTEETEQACIARAMAIRENMLAPEDKSQKPSLSVAIDRYIEARESILSPATIRGYRSIQKSRFQSQMKRPVNSMSERDWQRAVNAEAKLCASKTLKNAWGFVSSVLREETGTLYSISLPQVVSEPREFLEPDQIKVFLEHARGNKYEIPALLALCSLRVSEIIALTWDQIDLEDKIISVKGAVVPNEHHQYVKKKENKNQTSRREVPIMIPQLLDALKAADKRNPDVVPYHPRTIQNAVNRICKEAGLPEVGTHGLRHSFASLAYHLNMPEKIAMQIGGWSNDATMRKIYTHVSKKDVISYQNALSAFYENE